jgi:hypothetical protein
MHSLRRTLVLRFAPLPAVFLWVSLLAQPAVATPVQYIFSSTCSFNCGDWGLTVGSPVSTTITINSSEIMPGMTVSYSTLNAGDSVSMNFGATLSTSTGALLGISPSFPVNITYNADATALDAVFQTGGTGIALSTPGLLAYPELATIYNPAFPGQVGMEAFSGDSLGEGTSVFDTYTPGRYLISSLVPEPTTAVLIGFGVVILAGARRLCC